MARDYDWENISKLYTALSQRVIITRSWDRKIRSHERNCDRRGDFLKRARHYDVLGCCLMAGTLSEINIFCSRCHAVAARAVSKVISVSLLHGPHRFDETFLRNITFLSIELNARIYHVGFGVRSRNFPLPFYHPPRPHPLSSSLRQQVGVSR